MILHLGSDVAIRTRDLVAVFDYAAICESVGSKEFLEVMKSEGKLVRVSDETVKSAVVTSGNVYLSPISSLTIARRARNKAPDFATIEGQ